MLATQMLSVSSRFGQGLPCLESCCVTRGQIRCQLQLNLLYAIYLPTGRNRVVKIERQIWYRPRRNVVPNLASIVLEGAY